MISPPTMELLEMDALRRLDVAVNDWFTTRCTGLFLTTAALAVFLVYYLVEVVKPPSFSCGQSELHQFLVRHCPSLSRRYWCTPWCLNGVVQSVVSYATTYLVGKIKYTREILKLPDGGQVSLDWLDSQRSRTDPTCPTIILLPGFNGDSQSYYMKSLVLEIKRMKYRGVVFNQRGTAGVQLITSKPYSAANYFDLRCVIQHVKQKFPMAPIIAAGTSYGGNIKRPVEARYLQRVFLWTLACISSTDNRSVIACHVQHAEPPQKKATSVGYRPLSIVLGQYVCNMGSDTGLEAAFLLSSPYVYREGLLNMESGLVNICMTRYLMWLLLKNVRKYETLFRKEKLNMEIVFKSKTFREFEAHFTLPLLGYNSLDEYFGILSLRDKLKRFQVPVMGVIARDDPFSPPKSLPKHEDYDGSLFSLVCTERGGHLGFMRGFGIGQKRLSDKLFHEFCTAIFEKKEWKSVVKKRAIPELQLCCSC